MTAQTKAIVFHTLEVIVATALPFLINYIAKLGANSPEMLGVSYVLVAAAKSLRDAGVLPDYVSTSPTAAQPVGSVVQS